MLVVSCFGFSLSRWIFGLKRKPIFPYECVWQWVLFLFLFFQHFLMKPIPKEASFLAGLGGSGSGYQGG